MIDAGSPRNAPAERVHGLLGRDGMPPGELLDRGRSRMVARAGFLGDLGLEVVEHPVGGSYLPADATGLTSLPGVYVAGNVADPSAQVGAAAAAGALAGARINADLVEEETTAALAISVPTTDASAAALVPH